MQSPLAGVMIKTNYRFRKVVYCQFREFPDQKISSENICNSSIKQTEQGIFVDIYLYVHKELYKIIIDTLISIILHMSTYMCTYTYA